MSQEKMKVLTLLEDGIISATEAIDLLDALKLDQDVKKQRCEKVFGVNDFDEKIRDFGKNVEQFAKEIGEKLNDTAKVVEPKLKKTARIVVEKTAAIIDEISKSLQDAAQEENVEKEECCCCNREADEQCSQEADDKPIEN